MIKVVLKVEVYFFHVCSGVFRHQMDAQRAPQNSSIWIVRAPQILGTQRIHPSRYRLTSFGERIQGIQRDSEMKDLETREAQLVTGIYYSQMNAACQNLQDYKEVRGCLVYAHASPTKSRAHQNFGIGFARPCFASAWVQQPEGIGSYDQNIWRGLKTWD